MVKPTSGWDQSGSLGHPCKFQRVSHLGSVTARHSSIGRQPNFAALTRGRHLYSAGRPSRWALAHILVAYDMFVQCCWMLASESWRKERFGVPFLQESLHQERMTLILWYLLRPLERWRSIVMSTVCLCVCLSVREDISGATHTIFTKFLVHVAYGYGSVLLGQGDEIPRGRDNWGFPPN